MPARPLLKTYAEEVGVTCAACGVEMRHTLQVVVDGAKDPEAEALARDGGLRRLTCPNGHTAGLRLPLMLRRPGCEPRLVFYPTADDLESVWGQLLGMLDLAEFHDLGFATPEAAAEACCVVPGALMADAVQPYECYLKLVGSTPRFFERLLAAHIARERMRARPDAPATEAAIAAWSAIAQDAAFGEAPVWLQRGTLSELAFAYDAGFRGGRDPRDADQAIDAFAAALSLPIDHPAYGAYLRRNYAMALAKRFDRHGRRRDLDAAIAVLQLAVPELTGAAAADAEGLLASALTARRAMLGAREGAGDLERMLEAQVERAGTDAERLKAEAALAMAGADGGSDPGVPGRAESGRAWGSGQLQHRAQPRPLPQREVRADPRGGRHRGGRRPAAGRGRPAVPVRAQPGRRPAEPRHGPAAALSQGARSAGRQGGRRCPGTGPLRRPRRRLGRGPDRGGPRGCPRRVRGRRSAGAGLRRGRPGPALGLRRRGPVARDPAGHGEPLAPAIDTPGPLGRRVRGGRDRPAGHRRPHRRPGRPLRPRVLAGRRPEPVDRRGLRPRAPGRSRRRLRCARARSRPVAGRRHDLRRRRSPAPARSGARRPRGPLRGGAAQGGAGRDHRADDGGPGPRG